MPVDLPLIDSGEARPSPPGAYVWLALFIVFMLVGVVTTLLTWPKGEPTSTPWFWSCLLLFPGLAWCAAFGARKLYHEREIDRIDAEEEMAQEDREEGIEFGSEPLAVLASAYRCAMGADYVASSMLRGDSELQAQPPRLGGAAIRHTALAYLNDAKLQARYNTLFVELMSSLSDVLEALPRDVRFDVCLQLPADGQQEDLLALWKACWQELAFRPAQVSLLSADQGVMVLDQWLDVYGGPELQKITLFVAAQLHENPPENSAEAGVALLLCWPLVAVQKKMQTLAMLHRPLETVSTNLNADLPTALLWGQVAPADVKDVWQTGLDRETKAVLIKAASGVKLSVANSESLSGFHDVDNALGNAGAAASWLATALAIEHTEEIQQPQLIACRENSLRLMVVQPISNDSETETT